MTDLIPLGTPSSVTSSLPVAVSFPVKLPDPKVGRPTVMTPEVLGKLEEAFMWSYTDKEACFYAGISPSSLYDYQVLHPEFTERKEALRLTPNLAAKKVLTTSIHASLDQARWWAAHKMSDDFATKSKVEHEGKIQTEDVTIGAAEKAVVDEFNAKLRDTIAQAHKK